MENRHTHILKFPIEHGGETITELKFRRVKFKDIRGITLRLGGDADGGFHADVKGDDLITLTSRLAGVSTTVIDELDGEDAAEVASLVVGFYSSFRPTGERP